MVFKKNFRLPDPLGLPPPRLHPHDNLIHHSHHPHHQLSEGISRISEGSRLSDGGISRLSDSLSEAHSPPLVATNLTVTGPLRVAVPSPHTPSSGGSPPSNHHQTTPLLQTSHASHGLIRLSTPPPNPKPPQIHRPFSPAWYRTDLSSSSRDSTASLDNKSYGNRIFEVLWVYKIFFLCFEIFIFYFTIELQCWRYNSWILIYIYI